MTGRRLTMRDLIRDVGTTLAVLDSEHFAPRLIGSLHEWCSTAVDQLYHLGKTRSVVIIPLT